MLPNVTLPAVLKPRQTASLIRLGRAHDGGYLVDERDIAATDVLLGFGIRDDWSFEEDFVGRKPVNVYAFDPTISERAFFAGFLKAIPRIYRPGLAARRYRTWAGFKRFFSGGNRHFARYVGKTSLASAVSLAEIMADLDLPASSKIFLKVDIEGSEYRILEEMIDLADRMSGAVIEFHDVDLHLERIEAFVKRFPLSLCHVHGNNFSPLSPGGVPLTIECSFTSQQGADAPLALPHRLDMPNDPAAAEYALTF